MDHQIQETELVPRKQAKMRFRERILQGWDYCCAYCGDPLGKNATLDHVHPKCKGGETTLSNMVGCCFPATATKAVTTGFSGSEIETTGPQTAKIEF